MEATPEYLSFQFPEDVFNAIGKNRMLIGAQNGGRFNAMTAAWGALGTMWNKNAAFIVVRESRFTKEFIDSAKMFSVSFLDHKKYAKEYGYFGSVSGRDEDKIVKSGLHVSDADGVPYFTDARQALICKKLFACPFLPEFFIDKGLLDNFYKDKDYHTLYIGEVMQIINK